MAATLTSKLTLLLNSLLANTVGVAAVTANLDRSTAFSLASGVGADQADKVYSTTITRTHGAPAGDLDLAGTLTDVFGVVITMARIKAIVLNAAAANVNSVVVGGGATTPIVSMFFDYVATALAQPALKIRPGGLLCLVAPDANGYVVTAATADKLQIANGDEDASTSVSVDVVIIGAST
jgi:hypothetical protein